MKTIILLNFSLFLSLGNLHAQAPVGCCSSADDGEVVTIKGCRANATVYYIDGILVQNYQQITAEVVDQDTGEPVRFATVRAFRNGAFYNGTITDETGFFQIDVMTYDSIVISYVGYAPVSFNRETLLENPLVEMKAGLDLDVLVIYGDQLSDRLGCNTICCFSRLEDSEETVGELTDKSVWNWSYYPNPTQDNVVVSTGEKAGTIMLYSTEGRLIRQHTIQSTEELISLSGLPSATYLLVYNGYEEQEVIGHVVLID